MLIKCKNRTESVSSYTSFSFGIPVVRPTLMAQVTTCLSRSRSITTSSEDKSTNGQLSTMHQTRMLPLTQFSSPSFGVQPSSRQQLRYRLSLLRIFHQTTFQALNYFQWNNFCKVIQFLWRCRSVAIIATRGASWLWHNRYSLARVINYIIWIRDGTHLLEHGELMKRRSPIDHLVEYATQGPDVTRTADLEREIGGASIMK